MKNPDLADFQEVLRYDPDTGYFHHLTPKGNKPGDLVVRSKDSYGYIRLSLKGKRYSAHRVAFLFQTGEWPRYDVDHKNGVRDDNRWCNLRLATRAQNLTNQPKLKGKSRFKGVTPHQNRWLAQYGRKIGYIGVSKSEQEAALMYNHVVEREVGSFGKFNQVFEDVEYG